MKRNFPLGLIIAVLLSATHDAPAPIAEESPTPAATAKTRPRPKLTPQPTLKPKPTPLSWSGTWRSPEGILRLSQTSDHVSGTYDWNRGGVVDGTVSGNILSGTWTDNNHNSGVFRLSLTSDQKSFSGSWTWNGQSGPWTGQRQ